MGEWHRETALFYMYRSKPLARRHTTTEVLGGNYDRKVENRAAAHPLSIPDEREAACDRCAFSESE